MEGIGNQHKSLKATLDEKKDNRNVLLLYVRDDAQHFSIDQQEQLNAMGDQLAEHDLDVVVLIASQVVEPDRLYLMANGFDLVPSEEFVGWVIGKNGAVKQKFTEPMAPEALFDLVNEDK